MPSDELVVDWAKCMEQVCDDISFLEEVMSDLVTEASTAKDEMSKNLSSRNFTAVAKSAHKVKGSASYLYCNHLRVCSMNLQDLGHQCAGGADTDANVESLNRWFEDYCEAYTNLVTEIRSHFDSK